MEEIIANYKSNKAEIADYKAHREELEDMIWDLDEDIGDLSDKRQNAATDDEVFELDIGIGDREAERDSLKDELEEVVEWLVQHKVPLFKVRTIKAKGKKGWKFEPARHALSAKGIKTRGLIRSGKKKLSLKDVNPFGSPWVGVWQR